MATTPRTRRTKGLNKDATFIKKALLRAIKENGGQNYFNKLARDRPELFLPMVSKSLIPNKINVDTTLTVDIGQAMVDAGERLKLAESLAIIDVVPELIDDPDEPDMVQIEAKKDDNS